ncbi:MAG TPA: DUF1460 domain-containing protein, partial [Myxococcota bacterium]|nr:DUF1460 domain-containing protein [Myxococcota bacterium]
MPAACLGLWLTLGLLAPCLGLPAGDGGLAARLGDRARLATWLRGGAALQAPAGRIDALGAGGLQALLRPRGPDPGARLAALSARFLEVPYLLSPLGEGPGHPPDEDPLLRLDAVDCTTFVEQVMAFARARDLAGALRELRRIRYLDGRMEFGLRKHDMLAQWLPDNQRLGVLEDITQEVGGADVRWISKRYDERLWAVRRRAGLWASVPEERLPRGEHRLPVVPLGRVPALAGRIPEGTLLNVLREEVPGRVTRVTHQGLVVR